VPACGGGEAEKTSYPFSTLKNIFRLFQFPAVFFRGTEEAKPAKSAVASVDNDAISTPHFLLSCWCL
jgi:hypothetical protein